jgi:hypothetical protein
MQTRKTTTFYAIDGMRGMSANRAVSSGAAESDLMH